MSSVWAMARERKPLTAKIAKNIRKGRKEWPTDLQPVSRFSSSRWQL
jgi:hypothetical protein